MVKKTIGDWLSSLWDRIGAPAGASISADIAAAEAKVDTAIADVGVVDGKVDAIQAKTDLLNSAVGTNTLNDANTSDTIVPGSLPTNIHITFDISNLNNVGDDFEISVTVGVAASERVVSWYGLTSDGADITCDAGSGTGAIIAQRRIDISDVLVYTGEQVVVTRTKNSVNDRDVVYKYVCGA